MFQECTKHVKIDYHVVQEKITQGLIKMLPITSNL